MSFLHAIAQFLAYHYPEFRHGHFNYDPVKHCLIFNSLIPLEESRAAALSARLIQLDIGVHFFLWLDPNENGFFVQTHASAVTDTWRSSPYD